MYKPLTRPPWVPTGILRRCSDGMASRHSTFEGATEDYRGISPSRCTVWQR